MLTWFAENLATLLIGAGLLMVVALIVVSMIKNKKKGKSACGSGCGNCPMSGACHSEKE